MRKKGEEGQRDTGRERGGGGGGRGGRRKRVGGGGGGGRGRERGRKVGGRTDLRSDKKFISINNHKKRAGRRARKTGMVFWRLAVQS